MNTHICMISAELMPNIIGALYDHADTIIPVITDESEWLVNLLCSSLSATGNYINVKEPVRVIPFDLRDCMDVFNTLANNNPRPCFNWTGGTKVMSYAARSTAEKMKARAIYVLNNSREILIEDFSKNTSERFFTDSATLGLNILSHLYAAGNTVKDARTPEDFQKIYKPADELVIAANAIIDANQSERRDLFGLANAANEPFRPRNLNPYFLDVLRKAKLIQPGHQHGEYFLNVETLMPLSIIESPQDANSRFIRASFLEVFLWSQVVRRSGFEEVGWGIQLNPGQTGRFMEIDVAVAGDGKLLVIEAKLNVDLQDLTDWIEEQHARCNRIAGKFGRWILYIHKFKGEFIGNSDAGRIVSAEARAKNFGGMLLWHDDLEHLPEKVSEILNNSHPLI
ncbi:MAG: DUF1887 family protein [Verrucomicrobiae bacterium]|nr:DUF1887 family protein [Verrucomicrobiae bacterium]